MENNFFENEVFLNMSEEKQAFIRDFVKKDMPKQMSQAMPFLMTNIKAAKSQNISFSNEEVQLIAQILCKDLPQSEVAKVDKILKMMHRK